MQKKQLNKRRLILFLILILLLLLMFWQYKLGVIERNAIQAEQDRQKQHELSEELRSIQVLKDSLAALRLRDSLLLLQMQFEQQRQDSLAALQKKSVKLIRKKTVPQQVIAPADTIHPLIRVSPTTGRYFEPFIIQVTCNETNCSFFIATEEGAFEPYIKPLKLSANAILQFFAIDSAGNHSDTLVRKYELTKVKHPCPADMLPVPLSNTQEICMDIYEWPNTYNEKPTVFVSHAEAEAHCSKAGKRLCLKDEWQTACRGKLNTEYPYGSQYDQNTCVTDQTTPNRSGRNSDCRSFFGHHDMSGNVWEWTGTPHEQRSSYYYVSGGNWSSSTASTCSESKYSFFPQNQYQFVGFRCCKEK